jgi:hypothetical protein
MVGPGRFELVPVWRYLPQYSLFFLYNQNLNLIDLIQNGWAGTVITIYNELSSFMFWLNVDLLWKSWKLHRESCRHCKPKKSATKGINIMKDNGGWFSFQTIREAQDFYEKHGSQDNWQPCKVCQPEHNAS